MKTTILLTTMIVYTSIHSYGQSLNIPNKISQPYGLKTKSLTAPIFVDIDGDGDLDVFGVEPGMVGGKIFYQENTGTTKAPAFAEKQIQPFGLVTQSLSSPTLVDIDNDGDFDLFAVETKGAASGKIFYQENTGTNKAPAFATITSQPFGLTTKSLTAPTLVDIDNDGDLDLFGAELSPTIKNDIFYQENTGTNKAPAFGTMKAFPFGLFIISMSSPTFIDLDKDGDLDVFGSDVGVAGGKIFYHENKGTNKIPSFGVMQLQPFGLSSKSLSAPTFVDIDGDGVLESFGVDVSGLSVGKIFVHKNTK